MSVPHRASWTLGRTFTTIHFSGQIPLQVQTDMLVSKRLQPLHNLLTKRRACHSLYPHRVCLDSGHIAVVTHPALPDTKPAKHRFGTVDLLQHFQTDHCTVWYPRSQTRHGWPVPIGQSPLPCQLPYIGFSQSGIDQRCCDRKLPGSAKARSYVRHIVQIGTMCGDVNSKGCGLF